MFSVRLQHICRTVFFFFSNTIFDFELHVPWLSHQRWLISLIVLFLPFLFPLLFSFSSFPLVSSENGSLHAGTMWHRVPGLCLRENHQGEHGQCGLWKLHQVGDTHTHTRVQHQKYTVMKHVLGGHTKVQSNIYSSMWVKKGVNKWSLYEFTEVGLHTYEWKPHTVSTV